MSSHLPHNRRSFLIHSVSGVAALGSGVFIGNHIFADPTQIASKVQETPDSHPLAPALQMGTKALAAMDGVKDYRAEFIKREMIGRKLRDATMALKLREDPFSIYLKFLKPTPGREALYVEGQNDGRLKAHDVGFAGLAGTLTLDVDGNLAMADNRHPMTMIGMKTLAMTVLEQWLNEVDLNGIDVNYYPNARIGKVSCKAIETSHREQQADVKFQKTRLYVEQERGLPIRVQQYEFGTKRNSEPVLVEDYLYSNVELNVGLTDADFSVTNPQYNF